MSPRFEPEACDGLGVGPARPDASWLARIDVGPLMDAARTSRRSEGGDAVGAEGSLRSRRVEVEPAGAGEAEEEPSLPELAIDIEIEAPSESETLPPRVGLRIPRAPLAPRHGTPTELLRRRPALPSYARRALFLLLALLVLVGTAAGTVLLVRTLRGRQTIELDPSAAHATTSLRPPRTTTVTHDDREVTP